MNKRGIYQGISLPKTIINSVKDHIKKHPEYKSNTEFIRDAIREKMRTENSYSHEHPSIHGFLYQLDNLTNYSKQMKTTDNRFEEILTATEEIRKKLNLWGYNVGTVDLPQDVSVGIAERSKKLGISPSEYLKSLITKDMNESRKKKT